MILFLGIGFMSGMAAMFPYCYFGKLASTDFEKICDRVYHDIDWTELPLEFKKIIV